MGKRVVRNVQSSGIGNKESRPVIHIQSLKWNDYLLLPIDNGSSTLLIIEDRRFYDISLPFAGIFYRG